MALAQQHPDRQFKVSVTGLQILMAPEVSVPEICLVFLKTWAEESADDQYLVID